MTRQRQIKMYVNDTEWLHVRYLATEAGYAFMSDYMRSLVGLSTKQKQITRKDEPQETRSHISHQPVVNKSERHQNPPSFHQDSDQDNDLFGGIEV